MQAPPRRPVRKIADRVNSLQDSIKVPKPRGSRLSEIIGAMQRRQFLFMPLGAAAGQSEAAQEEIVETHVHLFSDDLKRFPQHPNGGALKPSPLEDYLRFAKEVGIMHSTHVSAEPYQDDMRYLEYTLDAAPEGFLKGTVLFDPISDATPKRMEDIAKRRPGQILALRIHCTRGRDEAPTTSGPLRDRDLMHPEVRNLWRKTGQLGMAVQAHIQPWFAPQIEKLVRSSRILESSWITSDTPGRGRSYGTQPGGLTPRLSSGIDPEGI